MSSKTAIRPRTYFLKKQGASTQLNGNRLGFNLHTATKATFQTNANATKESMDLKDYAEKMMREQTMSSQKLSQLAISLQQMTRTIGFFLTNIEKRHSLIKSLTTLKTENSRLKEMIASKNSQVNDMANQLESVTCIERNLHDLISELFSKLESVKQTHSKVEKVLFCQEEKAQRTTDTLMKLHLSIDDHKQAQDNYRQKMNTLQQERSGYLEEEKIVMKKEEEEKKTIETMNQITQQQQIIHDLVAIMTQLTHATNCLEKDVDVSSVRVHQEQSVLESLHQDLEKREEDSMTRKTETDYQGRCCISHLEELEMMTASLKKEKESREAQRVSLEAYLLNAQQNMEHREKEMKEKEKILSSLRSEAESTSNKQSTLQETVTTLTSQVMVAKEEIDKTGSIHVTLLTEVHNRTVESTELQQSLVQMEEEKKKADTATENRVHEREDEVKRVRECVLKCCGSLGVTVLSVDEIDRRQEQMKKEMNAINTEGKAWRERMKRLEKDDVSENMNELQQQHRQLERELRELSKESLIEVDVSGDAELRSMVEMVQKKEAEQKEALKSIQQRYEAKIDTKMEAKQTATQKRAEELEKKELQSLRVESYTPKKKTSFTPLRKQRKQQTASHMSLSSLSRKSKLQFEPVRSSKADSKGDWFNDDFFNSLVSNKHNSHRVC